MDDNDLKKLRDLIKEEIRPVKDLVEVTKKKVDGQQIFLHTTAENVRVIKEQQSVVNEKIDKHTKILEKHGEILTKHGEILEKHSEILAKHGEILEKHSEKLGALWEQTVKLSENMEEVKDILRSQTKFIKSVVVAADQNNDNVKRLNKRVRVLEDKSGIVPPVELTIIG